MKATRNTPEQKAAIAKMNARARYRMRDDGRSAHHFPAFEPGWSTAFYVKVFESTLQRVGCIPNIALTPRHDQPAPFYVGPEVVDESEQLEEMAA